MLYVGERLDESNGGYDTMINIVTGANDVINIQDVDYLSSLNMLDNLDTESLNAIQTIEGVAVIDRNVGLFRSKINNNTITVSQLSSGCRTVLGMIGLLNNKNDISKYVISITPCGDNAIEYILDHFSKYDINVVCNHLAFGFHKSHNIRFNGQEMDIKSLKRMLRKEL